jgi:hypothetical protein
MSEIVAGMTVMPLHDPVPVQGISRYPHVPVRALPEEHPATATPSPPDSSSSTSAQPSPPLTGEMSSSRLSASPDMLAPSDSESEPPPPSIMVTVALPPTRLSLSANTCRTRCTVAPCAIHCPFCLLECSNPCRLVEKVFPHTEHEKYCAGCGTGTMLYGKDPLLAPPAGGRGITGKFQVAVPTLC